MERKIGETFEFKGKTYEVIESLRNICDNCAFSGECDATETVVGRCSCTSRLDGKNVIFKEIKDNQLTINIPKGMEIDIENCDLKNGIIKFKKEELHYEDIENSLDLEGNRTGIPVDDNNAFKLCATDRLMNIARYYNGDWKPDWRSNELKYFITFSFVSNSYSLIERYQASIGPVSFKNKKDAEAVIYNPNFREILDSIFKN